MNWVGSGFIPIIIYQIFSISGVTPPPPDDFLLLDGTDFLLLDGTNFLLL
jgi:hypothetical protein